MLDWNLPFAMWFIGGKLNVAVNCVDRHVAAGLGPRVAFHWEGEPGDTRTITYDDLRTLVSQAANGLTELGVRAGDKVAIYMPMIPETVVAMLACARLGAPHTALLARIRSVLGCGMLLVEHDMTLVRDICDYIYVLEFGQLIFEGTAEEMQHSPQVRAAYLGDFDDPADDPAANDEKLRGGAFSRAKFARAELGHERELDDVLAVAEQLRV